MAAAERIDGASRLMIDINPEVEGKLAIVSAMGSHPTSPLKVSVLGANTHIGAHACVHVRAYVYVLD